MAKHDPEEDRRRARAKKRPEVIVAKAKRHPKRGFGPPRGSTGIRGLGRIVRHHREGQGPSIRER